MKAQPRLRQWELATIVGLIATATGPIVTMMTDRAFAVPGLIFVLIGLGMVGLVLTRNRWLIIAVVAISAVLLLGAIRAPIVRVRLADPAATGYFIAAVLQLFGSALATGAGLGTFVQIIWRGREGRRSA